MLGDRLPSCQVSITADREVTADLHEKVLVTGSKEDLNFYISSKLSLCVTSLTCHV